MTTQKDTTQIASESPITTLEANLTDAETFDGFTVFDLIAGIHSVSVAINHLVIDQGASEIKENLEYACGLAQASKVLSAMLRNAVYQ